MICIKLDTGKEYAYKHVGENVILVDHDFNIEVVSYDEYNTNYVCRDKWRNNPYKLNNPYKFELCKS